jgi:hypothetical protein
MGEGLSIQARFSRIYLFQTNWNCARKLIFKSAQSLLQKNSEI